MKLKSTLGGLRADSLYRNSMYLMLSTATMGVLGFLFWVVCAHLYPANRVGSVTSLVSAAALATTFSSLGYSNTIIRFLPSAKRRSEFVSTALLLTFVASIVAGSVCFAAMRHVADGAVGGNIDILIVGIAYLVYIAALTANSMFDSVLISYRSAGYVLVKNTLMSCVKVGIPLVMVGIGSSAMLAAIVGSMVVSVGYGAYVLRRRFGMRLRFELDAEAIADTRRFALGNYAGTMFSVLPASLTPIIVLDRLGSSQAAYIYMPMMLVGFLNVIPSASAQSLFAEVSNDMDNLGRHLRRSVAGVFLLLLPASLILLFASEPILAVFGRHYADHGEGVLRLLTIGSVVGALNFMGDNLCNMLRRVRMYVIMNAFNALLIVGLVLVFAGRGLSWVGLSWLFGQLATVIVYLWLNRSLVTSSMFPRATPAEIGRHRVTAIPRVAIDQSVSDRG